MAAMRERRRFLKVVGAAAGVIGAGLGCGGDAEPGVTTASGGDGGSGASGDAGGAGGQGGSSATGMGGEGGSVSALAVVGNVADVAEGELTAPLEKAMFIGRDAAGVYVMTSLCSHKFCDMVIKGAMFPGGIRCTCHSSKFDLNGAAVAGPASKPLEHYYCEVAANGDIAADATKTVDATFRAALP
ncbi:MAG: Rieske (2Fe-2S) protein [Myxococcales bacterium]|nr:Rieske (2Fe-2S) protein [Myxococcales bacterium]